MKDPNRIRWRSKITPITLKANQPEGVLDFGILFKLKRPPERGRMKLLRFKAL